eukprot:COSAG01_NODE_17175_length_1173_cov_0.820298_1_plen_42_part_10
MAREGCTSTVGSSWEIRGSSLCRSIPSKSAAVLSLSSCGMWS